MPFVSLNRKRVAVAVVAAVVVALGLALVWGYLTTRVEKLVHINGDSMAPALQNGDWVVVALDRDYLPVRGDIVIYRRPIPYFVKRVAAVGGETVEIRAGRVSVDGQPLTTPPFDSSRYVAVGGYAGAGNPYRVPAGDYFVLGDLGTNQGDSRFVGGIPRTAIVGVVRYLCWPPSRMGSIQSGKPIPRGD